MEKLNIEYYKAMYPRQGESGRLRDSAAMKHIHQDALSMQREMARRLASAAPMENETEKETKS